MKRIYSIISLIIMFITCVTGQLDFKSFTNLNDVYCQLEVGDNIWFGGKGGVSVRNKSTGSIVASFTTNEGLPNNDIKDMTKDLTGNIWLISDFGLSKYNGSSWENFNNFNTNIEQIVWNSLQCIEIDHTGNIWIGTKGWGVIMYDGVDFTFFNSSNVSINDTVNDIAINNSGDIWFATNNQGYIYIIDNKWVHVTGFNDNKLRKVSIDQNDSVWVSYVSVPGVTRFNPSATQKYVTYLVSEFAFDISIDFLSRVWIATGEGNNGVWIINQGIVTNHYLPTQLISPRVFSIIHDAQSSTWFGTPDGISRYDGANWVSYVNANTLSGNNINDIAIDTTKRKFFATDFGLTIKDGPTWTKLFQGATPLPHNDVTALELINNATLWIGTAQGTKPYDINTGIWGDSLFFPGTYINDIMFVEPNIVYFATGNSVGKKVGVGIPTIYNSGNGFVSNKAFCLAEAPNGDIWVGSDQGISIFNGTSVISTMTFGGGEIPTNIIMGIDFDSSGDAWLATNIGVVKIDGSPFKIYNYTNSNIKGHEINSIHIDELDFVWIGTNVGMSVYNGTQWASYFIENGLPSNSINKIYQRDIFSHRWVCTTNGVAKVEYQTPKANFTYDTICYSPTTKVTTLTLEAENIDSSSIIKWDIGNNGSIDYSSREVKHDFGFYGRFPVKLIVQNYYNFDTLLSSVLVGSEPDPVINPNMIKICNGKEISLNTNILNSDTIFNYDFLWSNGESTPNIKVSNNDTLYVTVSANKCSGVSPNAIIEFVEPFDSIEICMVTVDSVTNKNMILWERPQGRVDIVSFNVFKVLGTNFIPVGEVDWNSMTKFIDYQSTPSNVSARYALSVLDTCGNESALSPYHQTIHLSASTGSTYGTYELLWNDYDDESGGFIPDFYYIFRGNDASNLHFVQKVDGINTSYTDDNPTGERYYKISVNKPSGCLLSDTKLKSNSGPFSRSLSNLEDNRQQSSGISVLNKSNNLNVFPNPMQENAIVRFSNDNNSIYLLQIFNIAGEVVKTQNNISSNSFEILRNGLESGLYILRLSGEKIYTGKLIVN